MAETPTDNAPACAPNSGVGPDLTAPTWNEHVSRFIEEMTAILADRGTQYNGTEHSSRWQNFKNIADIFTITLQNELRPGASVSPRQVALMMVGMKLAREVAGAKHDSMIDAANYALIADSL